jgi:polyhydroxybutyrate depolymerase
MRSTRSQSHPRGRSPRSWLSLAAPLLSCGALALVGGCGSSSSPASSASTGSDGGTGTVVGGGNCGTRTTMRGKTTRTLMVDGSPRTYVAYVPTSLDATKPAPFVFVFHGATMDGQEMFDITQYSTIADSDGVAVAFLDGQGTSSISGASALDPWNVSDDGATVCGNGNLANNTNALDFPFMDAVKADISDDQCLDAQHVFATGFSMGGYFSHHVGCDRTDVRAIGPGSGGTIDSLSSCKTGHVPAIIFHGLGDPLIAPGCDDPNSTAQPGFPPSAVLWAQKNGCQTTYKTIAEPGTASGKDGQCYVFDGCPADGQVELCTFKDMGHCWAGGGTAKNGTTYSCPGYASATQLEWSFFKQYAW